MAIKIEKRVFIDNAHNYLLRIEEDLFQAAVRIANTKQISVNAVLNEAIQEYIEKQ